MSNTGFNTEQNEFQIDINPTNSRGYVIGTSNDYRAAGVGIYLTSDGGASWTAFDAPIGRAACCDPGVAYAYDGSVYVSILNTSPFVTYIIRSTDNGNTWTAPTNVQTNDRPNIVVDNGSSSPRRGTVYLTYTDENAGNPGSNQVKGYKSTDNGQTWGNTFFVGDVISPTGFEDNTTCGLRWHAVRWLPAVHRHQHGLRGWSAEHCGEIDRRWRYVDVYRAAHLAGWRLHLDPERARPLLLYSYSRLPRSSPILGISPTNPQHVYMIYSGGDLETPYTCATFTGYHSEIPVP